jgi:predicted metal-dependent peptidase
MKKPEEKEATALAATKTALRLACASLPHLAGLARTVRVELDRRVGAAGVFASGRLVVNPDFITGLPPREAAFVMAHELLHLALRTHERGTGSDPLLVNYAHDYIINDMLVHELGIPVPAGGLALEGARQLSVERIVAQLQANPQSQPGSAWAAPSAGAEEEGEGDEPPEDETTELGRIFQEAMRKAGLLPPAKPTPPKGGKPHSRPRPGPPRPKKWPAGDALRPELEREWYPGTRPQDQEKHTKAVREAAAKSASAGVLMERMRQLADPGPQDTGNTEMLTEAVKSWYHVPWEVALQRWLDAVAPGPRSYARPSRRGADRTDVVLAGRRREGWTLHIILDSSGSMCGDLPYALGAIATFCEGAGVEQVHVLQCDTVVTDDEYVTPEELARYQIRGLGGNDMHPAMLRLADDPEVEAVLILTDEDVTWYPYPEQPMPYQVLWVLMRPLPDWTPRYGQVIALDPQPT